MATSADKQAKILAAAVSRLKRISLQEAFDPYSPDSKPTPAQQQVIDDFGKIGVQYIVAGNRCLGEGTLVATSRGAIPIERVVVGDTVYDENGKAQTVLKTWNNGKKLVGKVTSRGQVLVKVTPEHKFWVVDERRLNNPSKKEVRSLGDWHRVLKSNNTEVSPGTKSVPEAYALGALLGDGCSTVGRSKYIVMSSSQEEIVKETADSLGQFKYEKIPSNNYNWRIYVDRYNSRLKLYNDWCSGNKAHEKIIDIKEISTWDRDSLVRLFAGLIDTDGTLTVSSNRLTIRLGMQAKSVIDAAEWIAQSLWQVTTSRRLDTRTKYVNGPLHILSIGNPHDVRRIYRELNQYIKSSHKRYTEDYNNIGRRSNEFYVGVKFDSSSMEEINTYDITVSGENNVYLLANGLITSNSGKSQLCSRLTAWMLTETHPTWKRPADWADEPLLILVAGRTGKQIEESLLPKITSFLEPGTYKEVRIGNIIQKLEYSNGNRVIFQSLENPNVARERLQSYTAHMAWLDEMPPTAFLMDELQLRVSTKGGMFLASFTPLVSNVEIKRMVDNIREPYGKRYQLKMFDNPVYADPEKQAKEIAKMASLPETLRRARLYGDWMTADTQVYHFDYNTMVEMPHGYSPIWRHVVSVDPAISSASGVTIWAERPGTDKWYCIKTEYVSGIQVPTEIVAHIEFLCKNMNVIKRIADPHEVWFIQTAQSMGYRYTGVYKKNDRKGELIKGLQEKLGTKVKLSTAGCDSLIEELQSCQWSETTEGKIVNGSRFHLLDSAQYFCDNIPKPENLGPKYVDYWDRLHSGHEQYLKNQEAKKQVSKDIRLSKPAFRPAVGKRWR